MIKNPLTIERHVENMQYKELTKPEVIALDLDETIHNVIAIYDDAFNQARQHLGLSPFSKEDIRAIHEAGYKRTSETYKNIFGKESDKALQYYYDVIHKNPISEEHIFSGVREMLEGAKKFNLPIIAVTNSDQHIAKKILRDIKLFDYFDSITGVKPDRALKPEPELLIIGLKKIGRMPGKNVWFMGDSATDTLCAKLTGCTGIRFYHTEKPIDTNADAFFSCHYEFLAAIEYFYKN